MSDPFIGEIRIFSFAYPPQGWAQCNGQPLPVRQNAALYALLGIQFGGTLNTSFNLPDLRGRVGINQGSNPPNIYQMGNSGGVETVALTQAQVPIHIHNFNVVDTVSNVNPPNDHLYAQVSGNLTPNKIYAPAGKNLVTLEPTTLSSIGGGSGHDNMQPYLVLNFCIATTGIYPPPQLRLNPQKTGIKQHV